MHPLFHDAADIRHAAAVVARSFGQEGAILFPHGRASHICIRTQDAAEQAALFELAKQLGKAHVSEGGDEPRFWVNLAEPIAAATPGQQFSWIEITGPKIDERTSKPHPTGPQMLVFIDSFQDVPAKHAAEGDPRFSLRCQNSTPEEQLGLH